MKAELPLGAASATIRSTTERSLRQGSSMTPKICVQLEKEAAGSPRPRLPTPSLAGARAAASRAAASVRATAAKIPQTVKFMAGAHDVSTPSGIGPNQPRFGLGNAAKFTLGPDIPFLDRPVAPPGPPGRMFGRAGQIAAAPFKSVGRDLVNTVRIGGDALRHVPVVGKYLGVNDGRTLGNLRQGLSSASRLIAGPVGGMVGAGIGAVNAVQVLPQQISGVLQNYGMSPEEIARIDAHMQKVGPANISWDLAKLMYNPQDPLSESVGQAARTMASSWLADNLRNAREGDLGPVYKALDWARYVRSPFGAVTTSIKDHIMNHGAPSLGIAAPSGKDTALDNRVRDNMLASFKETLPAALRDPNAMHSAALDFVKEIMPTEELAHHAANYAADKAKPEIANQAEQIARGVPDFAGIGTGAGLGIGAGLGLGAYGLHSLFSKRRKKNRLLGALTALGVGGLAGAAAGGLGGHWLSSQSELPAWANKVDWQGLANSQLNRRINDTLATGKLPGVAAAPTTGAASAPAAAATPATPAGPPPAMSPLQQAVAAKATATGDSAVRDAVKQLVTEWAQTPSHTFQAKHPGVPALLSQLADYLEKQNSYELPIAAALGGSTALGAVLGAYRAKKKSRLVGGVRGGALGLGTGAGAVGGGLLGGAAGAGIAAMTSLNGAGASPAEALQRILSGMAVGGVTGAGAGGYAGYRTMHDLITDDEQ